MNEREFPGEFELIDRIVRALPEKPSGIVIGPGDDCAGVEVAPGRLLLLTCDTLVEGKHFSRRYLGPYDLGRRLAAVNLSDIAAMGGLPLYALVSLVLSEEEAGAWTGEMARGVTVELSRFGAHLVGGNLSGAPAGTVADMTLVGEVGKESVLRRSGAREGDAILVTGYLGSSSAGLRLLGSAETWDEGFDELARAHVLPDPRIPEGLLLARSGNCTSAIDISDGLSSDLAHLCAASGVGADVNFDELPVLEATRRAAALLDLPVEKLVLSGGEDYELLFTVPEEHTAVVLSTLGAESGVPVTRIGTITGRDGGIRYLDAGGNELPPPEGGWDHFRSGRD